MYHVALVKSPSDDEIERMTDVLHEAFSYKYFISALGDPKFSRDLIKSHIGAALADDAAEIYVARSVSATRDIAGVAVWFGPGTVYLGTEAQREAGWNQLYAALDKVYQDWWDYFLPFYDDYTTRVFGRGVKLGGHHLQVIGVLPAHQRRGIAGQLFCIVEKKAKEQHVCTCLETVGTGNVPVYRSMGYDVMEPTPLRSAKDPNATAPLYGFIKHFV
ncbi:hypothetical protein EXIGLDRAFT_841255 [Exidia glandulosa HHB12029]|uniref:N-acetyltransferase domain-containing protein n=1 Tax=Exidia glandulosa HHB12029 TaxID=1314781 RepID=A0A165DZC3_EXIGL|nr:hypothetical protein EXIGLDRAFT_841255 [Exidia glandulosa HHB12029]